MPVLRPTPGKCDEVVERDGDLAAVAADDGLRHADEVLRLGVEEAGRPDELLELVDVGGREIGRLGYRANSAGVTMLTRSSVDCADRIVATSSWYAFA